MNDDPGIYTAVDHGVLDLMEGHEDLLSGHRIGQGEEHMCGGMLTGQGDAQGFQFSVSRRFSPCSHQQRANAATQRPTCIEHPIGG